MTAQTPREIEAKFEVDAAEAPKLRALLDRHLGQSTGTVQLTSVYYDTPAQELLAAGVTLRIRSDQHDRLVQTVKRSAAVQTGLFQRDEWETPLTRREPDLDAFLTTPAGQALVCATRALSPCFETLIQRTLWEVVAEGRHIEVALDQGEAVAGRHREAFVELELELKQGEARDLFGLVRAFDAIGSLRPGVLTKSQRGYRLMRNKPRRASKAEPVRLTKAMTSAEAFRAIAHACLRQFGLNVPIVVAHRAPEALHQTRVALRRLRSALSLFKELVADTDYPRLVAELRELSQALGEARNLDVYLAESAMPEAERAADAPGLQAFLLEMERRRSLAYDAVVARLRSPAFRSLQLRLLEWIEAGPWLTEDDALRRGARERPVRASAALILDKRRRRVKHRGTDLAKLDPQARHRVRIEAKKLRYASEFFASLVTHPKRQRWHAQFVAALEDLQGSLGQLNDIHTGHEIALSFVPQQNGAPAPPGVFPASHIDGRQEAEVEGLLAAADSAQAGLAKTKRFWSGWGR